METLSIDTHLGTFRTFGAEGVLYEVTGVVDEHTVTIRVVHTGETLDYALTDLLNDPEAL